MTKEDFLNLARPDMLGEFMTPILDNAPVWKILNAGKTYVYGYHHKLSFDDAVVSPIDLESFTKMLASGELSSEYYTIYLLGEEINNKEIENQPVSKKSEDFYCDINVSTGGKPCDFQCSDCKLMSSDEGIPSNDTIISVTKPTKTVWDLAMHEGTKISQDLWATRVPGGWLYETGRHESNYTFVPYQEQKFNTGCVLCGNTTEKTANIVIDVLDHLNEMGESLEVDTSGVLLNYIKEYLKSK